MLLRDMLGGLLQVHPRAVRGMTHCTLGIAGWLPFSCMTGVHVGFVCRRGALCGGEGIVSPQRLRSVGCVGCTLITLTYQ